MTVLAAFSYTLLAYGIPSIMFLVTVAKYPHEVITLFLGSFFWLLSFLISAFIWVIVPPLKDYPYFVLPISVLLQEVFRWLYYLALKKADGLLEMISEDTSELRKHKLAYVGGLGFGLIAAIVSYANVIAAATGPGIVGIRGSEDNQYLVLTSGLGALAITLLHVCWGVLFFDGFERKHWWWVVVVPVSHMVVSCLSLLNSSYSPVYFLAVAYVCLVVLLVLSLFVAGARPSTLKYFFTF